MSVFGFGSPSSGLRAGPRTHTRQLHHRTFCTIVKILGKRGKLWKGLWLTCSQRLLNGLTKTEPDEGTSKHLIYTL